MKRRRRLCEAVIDQRGRRCRKIAMLRWKAHAVCQECVDNFYFGHPLIIEEDSDSQTSLGSLARFETMIKDRVKPA